MVRWMISVGVIEGAGIPDEFGICSFFRSFYGLGASEGVGAMAKGHARG